MNFTKGVLDPGYPLPVTGAGNYFVADVLNVAPLAVRTTGPVPETDAEIDPGTVVVTIDRGGAAESVYQDTASDGNLVLTAGPIVITAGSINYLTGQLDLVFLVPPAPGLTVDINMFYFPALPVMGLRTEELAVIDEEKMVAFDQKYAYQYNFAPTYKFTELDFSAPTTWGGSDSKFFWTTNYYYKANGKLFWATNDNPSATGDPIRYFDTTVWKNFAPAIDAANFLEQCLCMLPFKGRLLTFNTWEGANLGAAVNFPNRVRWSWIGDPTDLVNGWLSTPGKGGFLDAATDEHIVSVEYLKDVILVKFERSSWKLVYTGDEIQPFVFQKINSVFGAISTNSLIPFDDGVYAVAEAAITTDDTTAVNRIDLKIPQQVINIQTEPGRVYGIRDLPRELVYWAYTDYANNQNPTSDKFNNQVLVFNYRNNSFARYNDSYTAYGTFQPLDPNLPPYPNVPELQQHPVFIPQSPEVAAGNQQGFVFLVNKQILNDPSLAIRDIVPGAPATFRVVNHNFSSTATYWVRIDGIIGTYSLLNYAVDPKVYRVVSAASANIISLEYIDPVTGLFTPLVVPAGGTYIGGGVLTVVQNFDIKTKVFAPYYEDGKQGKLGYIDFLADTTTEGQMVCLIYDNENVREINGPGTQSLLGENILITFPENIVLIPQQINQLKIWHRFFIQNVFQNFQIELTMNNAMMSSQGVNNNDFVLHAMTIYISANGRMVQ